MKVKALSFAIVMAAAAAAALSAEPAVRGLYLDQNIQFGCNPLGAQLGTKLFYRIPLELGEGILWESAKIDAGIENSLSPAYDFIGPFIDIEPIAIFDLALSARAAGYYDGLGYGFHDLSGYDAGFDADALDDLPSRNTGGWLLSVAPTLKFAYGALAFSDTLHVNYFHVATGEGYFYETYGNCVLRKKGVELYNDAYALVILSPSLMLGLNDSILSVPDSGYRSHILQAVGAFGKDLGPRLSLYAALTAGVYLEDRYYRYDPRVSGQVGITRRL
jgi:hypothetical protein